MLETPADSLDQNIWIFDADGRRIDGGAPAAAAAGRRRRAWARPPRTGDRSSAGSYRLLARPVPRPRRLGRARSWWPALDLTPYESSERRGLVLSLALGLLTVVGAGAAAWAASGYALQPGTADGPARPTTGASTTCPGRFELGAPRDELTELADTLDRMLDRIAQAILTERRLTDEVAHELRTPLTVIRSEAQLALLQAGPGRRPRGVAGRDRGGHGPDDGLDRHDAVAGPLRRTPTRRAARCRRRAGPGPGARARAAGRRGHRRRRPPRTCRSPHRCGSSPRPSYPLLDNARPARRAAGSACTSPPTARRVLLHVEDDGDGVDGEHRDRIFEPGHSTEPRRVGAGARALPTARALGRRRGRPARRRARPLRAHVPRA